MKIDTITNVTVPRILCTIQYILTELEAKNIEKEAVKRELDEIVALIVKDHKPQEIENEQNLSFSESMLSVYDSNDSLLTNDYVNSPDYTEIPQRNDGLQLCKRPIAPNLQTNTKKQTSIKEFEQIQNVAILSSSEESLQGLNDEYPTERLSLDDDEILLLKANEVSAIGNIEQILNEEIAPPRQVEQQLQSETINSQQPEPQEDSDPPNETKSTPESQQSSPKEIQDSEPMDSTSNSQEQKNQELPGRNQTPKQTHLTSEAQQGPSQGLRLAPRALGPILPITKDRETEEDSVQSFDEDAPSRRQRYDSADDSPVYPIKVYSYTSSDSTQDNVPNEPSKVPSKVASVVRKLFKFIPKTFARRHNLRVIKDATEFVDYNSDEFISPIGGYQIRTNIVQIEELPDETEETVVEEKKEDKEQKQVDKKVDSLEVGAWLDFSDREKVCIKINSIPSNTLLAASVKVGVDDKVSPVSCEAYSKCELPAKKTSESHLGIIETEDSSRSKSLSRNFANAVQDFKSSYGKDLNKNEKIEEREEIVSEESTNELKNKFIMMIAQDPKVKAKHPNKTNIDETTTSTESFKESDCHETYVEGRTKRKLSKKKLKVLENDVEKRRNEGNENRPLRILDSNENLDKERSSS